MVRATEGPWRNALGLLVPDRIPDRIPMKPGEASPRTTCLVNANPCPGDSNTAVQSSKTMERELDSGLSQYSFLSVECVPLQLNQILCPLEAWGTTTFQKSLRVKRWVPHTAAQPSHHPLEPAGSLSLPSLSGPEKANHTTQLQSNKASLWVP